MALQNSELTALVRISLASVVQIAWKSIQNPLKSKGDIHHETCNYFDINVTVYLFIYFFLTLYLVCIYAHLCFSFPCLIWVMYTCTFRVHYNLLLVVTTWPSSKITKELSYFSKLSLKIYTNPFLFLYVYISSICI